MGIDIYARWVGITAAEHEIQMKEWSSVTSGQFGYLREAYHGEPYATRHLCKEAFEESEEGETCIPASTLRERLDETLRLVEIREKAIYGSDENRIAEVKNSFSDFVALCEAKERETGAGIVIVASY